MKFWSRIPTLIFFLVLVPLTYAKLPYNVESIQIDVAMIKKLKQQPLKKNTAYR